MPIQIEDFGVVEIKFLLESISTRLQFIETKLQDLENRAAGHGPSANDILMKDLARAFSKRWQESKTFAELINAPDA